ncbi:hypothetical protein DINM_000916 [Dirofilaria immitis]|nr:hypothetical protein [Dirofilaria immitis]
MTFHIWKYLEIQILFTLLFIFLCSVLINGTPITTTPTGEINTVECDEAGECSNSQSHRARKRIKLAGDINDDESNLNGLYLKYMACAVPILDSVGKYLAALPSSDLLPVRISGKSLCVFATEVLLKRIKPLFIKDGNITNPIDRWIFPTYETSEDIYRDFFAVAKWQSQFSPNESNDLESIKRKPASLTTFASALPKMPYFFRMRTHQISLLSRVPSFRGSWLHKEAKLVFIFSKVSWSEMESATSDILSIRKNRSLPIIYVKSYMYFPNMPSYYYPFSSIIFHGSNVEASTFLVKTKDEKELREELLEWKRGLYFLKNYNIIAFYFMENEMITTNGKIFREIFNTEPFSVRFHKDWSKDVGLVHLNSTTSSLNDGSVFAIIGLLQKNNDNNSSDNNNINNNDDNNNSSDSNNTTNNNSNNSSNDNNIGDNSITILIIVITTITIIIIIIINMNDTFPC